MSDWSVRPATPADRDGIEAVLRASYPVLLRDHYEPAVLDAALPIMTRAAPALLASGRFHVAVDAAGAVRACGGWSEARPGTAEVAVGLGHIRHFATHPEACRRGLGRAIHDACARQAETAGLAAFACWSSLAAVPFYAALGFRAEGPITVRLAGAVPFPAVVMTRPLPRGGDRFR